MLMLFKNFKQLLGKPEASYLMKELDKDTYDASTQVQVQVQAPLHSTPAFSLYTISVGFPLLKLIDNIYYCLCLVNLIFALKFKKQLETLPFPH